MSINTELIAEDLNFINLFKEVYRNNPSNDLPYHNWYHTTTMINRCYEAGLYHDLDYHALKHLCIAALFHDYDHSGGEESDSENIKRALKGIDSFFNVSIMRLTKAPYSREIGNVDKEWIKNIVKITEFPFISHPKTIEQKIIRDADLLQFVEEYPNEMFEGLREEISVSRGETVSRMDMCLGQLEFLLNAQFYTDWGMDLYIHCLRTWMIEVKNKLNEEINREFENKLKSNQGV